MGCPLPQGVPRRPSLSPPAPPPPDLSLARLVSSPSDTREWSTRSVPLLTRAAPGAALRWMLEVTLLMENMDSAPAPAPQPHPVQQQLQQPQQLLQAPQQ